MANSINYGSDGYLI